MKSEVETLNKRIADLESKLQAVEHERDLYSDRLAEVDIHHPDHDKRLQAAHAENVVLHKEQDEYEQKLAASQQGYIHLEHDKDFNIIQLERKLTASEAENARLRGAMKEAYIHIATQDDFLQDYCYDIKDTNPIYTQHQRIVDWLKKHEAHNAEQALKPDESR